jgi:hypothetical protein
MKKKILPMKPADKKYNPHEAERRYIMQRGTKLCQIKGIDDKWCFYLCEECDKSHHLHLDISAIRMEHHIKNFHT